MGDYKVPLAAGPIVPASLDGGSTLAIKLQNDEKYSIITSIGH